MRARIVAAVALLALAVEVAHAQTLGEILRSRGLEPPAGAVPGLVETVRTHQSLEDQRGFLIVYAVGERERARLYATRFERVSRTWKTAPLEWSAKSSRVPTAGTARFSSGLRASDYVTVTAVTRMSPVAVVRFTPGTATIARAEGLVGHARAMEARADEAGDR